MRHVLLISALAALAGPAAAQAGRPPPPAPAPEPQRTTATFGDWTLRCVRPERAAPACEVTQTLLDKGVAVAQTAFGRPPGHGEKLRLTILVPSNVSLASGPRLVGAEGESGLPPVELSWRRCVPAGCIADAALSDDQLRRIRARTENARLVFQDSGGREAAMPFAPRGLAAALDALAKEDPR